MIYLPHRVSGGIVESACATCGSTRLVRSCAFDRMIDEEIKNRSNDPQLPDIGIRSGTACCGADHPSGPSGSLRDIPSVPAFRPACRSPEKHPAVPVRLLPRTLSPLPITRPRPQTAGPNAIAGTGTAPDAIPRTAVSSPGAATSGRRRHPIRPPKRTPPENTDAAPSRNLRTPPAPHSAPETNTARKHRRSTVPQPPDATGTHSPPPKRTLPENTDAAPSRSPRTSPVPHSAPETNTARKHRGSTVPQPPDAAGTHSPPPETNTVRKHRRSTVPQPPDAACPPFGPRNEHRPKTQTRHRSAAPPQKNAIIPAGTSSGRDDPHSERRRTASRDDGMSAVGPPSGKTALLPRQPSAPLRIPSSQAGRPLRLQKRSH